MTLNTGLAWGFTFFMLVAMTDIPATAQVAAALAWLIFVSILLMFGPKAFGSITTLNMGPASQPNQVSLLNNAVIGGNVA